MKFSLILATVGRVEELKRFLESLEAQRDTDFELFVVDQNPDDRLATLLASYAARFPLTHLRSARGLSRARNVALPCVTGDIVAFPDDDCWYAPDFLQLIRAWFEKHPQVDGLSTMSRDAHGQLSGCHWDLGAGSISKNNVWRRAISYSIFLRRNLVSSVGYFDVEIGVGAGTRWGSGEETDYLLRALNAGYVIYYEPALAVFHAQPPTGPGAAAKGFAYGLGFGHLLRKYQYPFRVVVYYWLRSFGGIMISIARGDRALANLRWGTLKGRIAGWLK